MKYNPTLKKLFDILFSTIALIVFFPIFFLISIFVLLDSRGPIFFKQQRIGQNLKPFPLLKFRSMSVSGDPSQSQFEPGDSRRVTRMGSFLRKTKLDELPELINVLNGDISIVGPRPEVTEYVNTYHHRYKKILIVRPGLSDYASIKYRNEEMLLANQPDPKTYYREVILPDKLRLAEQYVEEISFITDLQIIKKTLISIMK